MEKAIFKNKKLSIIVLLNGFIYTIIIKKNIQNEGELMKIVLVRHGESEINKRCNEGEKIYCGAYNVQLTEEGRKSAEELKNNTYIKQIEKIYSSDLDRAVETAKLATGKNDVIKLPILRERSLGKFEGKIEESLEKEYPEYFTNPKLKNFRHDFVIKAPDGENYQEVSKRCSLFLKELDLESHSTIGTFSHGVFIRCMIYVLMGLEKELVNKLKVQNCEPIVLEGNQIGKFVLKSHKLEELLKRE